MSNFSKLSSEEMEIQKVVTEAKKTIQQLEQGKQNLRGAPALQLNPPNYSSTDKSRLKEERDKIDKLIEAQKQMGMKTVEEKTKELPQYKVDKWKEFARTELNFDDVVKKKANDEKSLSPTRKPTITSRFYGNNPEKGGETEAKGKNAEKDDKEKD